MLAREAAVGKVPEAMKAIVEVRALNQGDTIALEAVAARRPHAARPRSRVRRKPRR